MKFRSIENKRINGDKLRITEPSAMFANNVKTIAVHTVNELQVGRIDLVSIEYFGTADYADLILKYNNISNPFSIYEGEVLNIPDRTVVKGFKPIGKESVVENPIRQQFLDSKRLTTKDANRLEYLKRKAAEKSNGAQPLPPNILSNDGRSEDSNLDINGDIITI